MAVQVGVSEQPVRRLAAPHLYVIDFERGPEAAPSIGRRRRAIRRRRQLRRARQALTAAGWAAGSVVLAVVVLAGMAGLR